MSVSFLNSDLYQPAQLIKPPQIEQMEQQKVKVPSLQDKLGGQQRQETMHNRETTDQLMHFLEKKKQIFESDKRKEHAKISSQKYKENLELKLSMGDGQPKHSTHFRKANKELQTFEKAYFLLPTLEKAKQYRQDDDITIQRKKAYLKQKAISKLEEPWNPTIQIANYFDNFHTMKPSELYEQTSSQYKITVPINKKIESTQSIKVSQKSLPRPQTSRSKGEKKSVQFEDQKQTPEKFHYKPTSGVALEMFKQQIAKQQQAKINHKSTHSSMSLSRVQDRTMTNASNFSRSQIDHTNQEKLPKEWKNSYHQREEFTKPLYDNLDIKLQSATVHFKPFKPTKTFGYDFNKYISLDAANRFAQSQRGSLECLQNVENESLEIRNPRTQHKKF